MNWTNYDRLVQHLKMMDPRAFDYEGYLLKFPGCVACQCVILNGDAAIRRQSSSCDIRAFLLVTELEACYLWSTSQDDDPYFETFNVSGIANALHRLAVVAAQYQRPLEQAPPIFQPNDAAFLASVRAIVAQPIAEAELEDVG